MMKSFSVTVLVFRMKYFVKMIILNADSKTKEIVRVCAGIIGNYQVKI